MKAKDYFSSKRIAFLALFTALVTVATYIIKIPSPSGQGYINVGDTIIFVCAFMFDPFFALIAGGVGSALADLVSGLVPYVLPTLIIKGLEGFVAAILFKVFRKCKFNTVVNFLISAFVGALIMVFGYFTAEGFMFGWGVAAAGLVFNAIQGGVGLVLGVALASAFKKIRAINSLLTIERLAVNASDTITTHSEENEDKNENSGN